MRADLVTIVGPPGTHVPDNDEITPSISSRQANVCFYAFTAIASRPKTRTRSPRNTLVGGAGMQRTPRTVERPVNVQIYR